MELEHLLWVGVAFVVSLLLVWLVWRFFCGDSKGALDDKTDVDDSDSFSSTQVITNTSSSHPRKVKRKRRLKRAINETSTNDSTTEDESAEEAARIAKNKSKRRRKSRKERSSSYQYKKNNYGLHDPFSEWAPKEIKFRDPITQPIVHNYPKSPSAPRRSQPHTTINIINPS